ncbi:MAG: hypothetical protein HYZ53_28295 [Planctomycetes bacterium]|nr:hypothetical protein [Planctomycetota bacterium]
MNCAERLPRVVLAATAILACLVPSCTGRKARESAPPPAGAGAKYGNALIRPPIVDGNLAVYPVSDAASPPVDVLTFDEAVAKGVVSVTEQGGGNGQGRQAAVATPAVAGGSNRAGPAGPAQQERAQVQLCGNLEGGGGATVNTLCIENRSDKPVFLMAGEIVKGGQQDRTIGQDMLLPPRSGPVNLAVFCVEHGRWQGQATFDSARLCADNSVRQQVLVAKAQTGVWKAVAGKNANAGATPETGTYLAGATGKDVDERIRGRLARLLDRMAAEEHLTGFVVAMDGQVVGADIFANPTICEKLREKLLRAYVFDAETTEKAKQDAVAPTEGTVAAFLADVAAGKATIERAPGSGAGYGRNRRNENDQAAMFTLETEENGPRLHECLQRR